MTCLLVSHESFFAHDTGAHPERVERLHAVLDALDRQGVVALRRTEAQAASREDILRCHSEEHYARTAATEGDRGALDPDTVFSPGTFRAVLHAAGAGITAVDGIGETGVRAAFAAVRPPGHHATADRAMGFCVFNNVAVAAAYLLGEGGLSRVAVVDWDVHHGSGTESIFLEESRVLYISLHQHPHYPGSGHARITGRGRGEGYNLNIPLELFQVIKTIRDLVL